MLCFFKNTPTASQNLSRRRETFLVELLGFERVSSYAPLSWPTYATLSTHCFGRESQMAEPGCYLRRPCISRMGKLRPGEAKEESHTLSWSPGLGQTQISGFQAHYSSSFIRGHQRAACGHLYPTDVLSLAQECFNLHQLPAFRNQEIPYKNPHFWLLLDHWEICQVRSAFLPGDH